MPTTRYASPLTTRATRSPSCAAAVIGLALLLASCRPREAVTQIPADYASLRGIVTVYAYATADLGRPPQSVDELMPVFEKASISDPEKLLSSTRDGSSFIIIWGVDIAGRYAGSEAPLAYERRGVDGERLVVTCGQQVKEVSERGFADLAWPEGYKPDG